MSNNLSIQEITTTSLNMLKKKKSVSVENSVSHPHNFSAFFHFIYVHKETISIWELAYYYVHRF